MGDGGWVRVRVRSRLDREDVGVQVRVTEKVGRWRISQLDGEGCRRPTRHRSTRMIEADVTVSAEEVA